MATPVEQVFNTPELLENILLRLDEQTLLLSQRTSRTVLATINGSPSLQRALWFQAPNADAGMEAIEINPLLRKLVDQSNLTLEISRQCDCVWVELVLCDIKNLQMAVRSPTYRQGSWRRMLLYRRQAKGNVFVGIYDRQLKLQNRVDGLESPGVVTAGGLVDRLLQLASSGGV